MPPIIHPCTAFDKENYSLDQVALHEAREQGTISTPEDFSAMMVEAWTGRYGDALQGEMDPMFWASKMHFYMTSPQFYNFPYRIQPICILLLYLALTFGPL